VPFFVLSLKVGARPEPDGGVSRHSLRPLVEPGGGNQAHRPGVPHRQRRRAGAQVRLPGTVEEKIDALIEGKQSMAREVLETGASGS